MIPLCYRILSPRSQRSANTPSSSSSEKVVKTRELHRASRAKVPFPIVALVGINVIKPDYYADVQDTPVFIPACLVVAGFLVANIFVMKMLVNIKV